MTIDSKENLPDWIFPWPEFDVDWDRTGLIIIDYQNYSSNPEVGLGLTMKESCPAIADYYIPRSTEVTIPNTKRLLDRFRELSKPIIHTRHGALLPDGSDMIARRRRRDADAESQSDRPAMWSKGDYEHEIIDILAPEKNELVIDKNSSSPFNGSGIDQLLRNLGIDTLIVSGMATDMCVETTSRDAADRGYNVIVVEDAVATFLEKNHDAALSGLARVFTQVWSTDDVLAELSK
ncbi:MAG: cysteine hydrolase [Lentisphaeria bacterium]|nr:cysteine hydrolase [Lentisphaeria bacterium]NQZ70207.1 cysteine hydrolase [Lentisphaeria bacterium]